MVRAQLEAHGGCPRSRGFRDLGFHSCLNLGILFSPRYFPPAKKQLTIRLDEDVLDWLKGHGKGYHTRINGILRVVMESQPRRGTRECSCSTALLTPIHGLSGALG